MPSNEDQHASGRYEPHLAVGDPNLSTHSHQELTHDEPGAQVNGEAHSSASMAAYFETSHVTELHQSTDSAHKDAVDATAGASLGDEGVHETASFEPEQATAMKTKTEAASSN